MFLEYCGLTKHLRANGTVGRMGGCWERYWRLTLIHLKILPPELSPLLAAAFSRRPNPRWINCTVRSKNKHVCLVTRTLYCTSSMEHWMPLVNNTVVSKDTPRTHYGHFVTYVFIYIYIYLYLRISPTTYYGNRETPLPVYALWDLARFGRTSFFSGNHTFTRHRRCYLGRGAARGEFGKVERKKKGRSKAYYWDVQPEVIVTIVSKLVYNLLKGLTTYLYRGYNPVTKYHGHSDTTDILGEFYLARHLFSEVGVLKHPHGPKCQKSASASINSRGFPSSKPADARGFFIIMDGAKSLPNWLLGWLHHWELVGGFKYVLCSSLFGEDLQFD